uniref:RING-type domain-containing protein n=1 Tax=Panagrellus redivivus TaxID=6233 RepID=A0A7E4ZQF8_PANRE
MKRPKFCLVNCKHVLCEPCGIKTASTRKCPICHRGPIKIVPINSKMDKRLQRLFMPPDKLIEEIDKKLGAMRSFEKHQVQLLTEVLGKMQNAFKKTKSECKSQLENEKKSKRALCTELEKIKLKYEELRKSVEQEKLMNTPAINFDGYQTPKTTAYSLVSAASTGFTQFGNLSAMSRRSGIGDALNVSGDSNNGSFRLDLDMTHRVDANSSFRCTTPTLLCGGSDNVDSAMSIRERPFLNTSFGSEPPTKTKRYSVLRECMDEDNEDDVMNRSASSSQGGRFTPTTDPFSSSGIQMVSANSSGSALLNQLTSNGNIPKPTKLATFSGSNRSFNNSVNCSNDSIPSTRSVFAGIVSKGPIVPRF